MSKLQKFPPHQDKIVKISSIFSARALRIVIIAFAATGTNAWADDIDPLIISSRQGMLVERLLKAYVQRELQVQPDKAATEIQQALIELRDNNTKMKSVATPTLLPSVSRLSVMAEQLAAVVSTAFSVESAGKLFTLTEEFLGLSEKITSAYHETPPAILLNLASRQRMLSQRVAAMYFLQQSPLKSKSIQRLLEQSDMEFKNSTTAFEDHKSDFPGISANLELARMQMIFLDNAVHRIDVATKEQINTVATASDRILSQMDGLTSNVQSRLADQSQPAKPSRKSR